MRQKRIVTPEQLKQGYVIYHHDQIPNMTYHPYCIVTQLDDGNYIVYEPDTEARENVRR